MAKKKKEEVIEVVENFAEEIIEEVKGNGMEEKIKELEDKNLRLLADFNNYKKRMLEESLKSKNLGKIEVIRSVIDAVDNFERALKLKSEDLEFKKGMEMIYNNLIEKLKTFGVEEVETSGIMNPNIHQALMVDKVDNKEDDEIIEVLQKGYILDGILIRPSLVKVNKK